MLAVRQAKCLNQTSIQYFIRLRIYQDTIIIIAKLFIYTLLETNICHPCEKKVNDVRFGHKLEHKTACHRRSLVYTDNKSLTDPR